MKNLILLAVFTLFTYVLHAQNATIQGKIIDEMNGQTVPGAKIFLDSNFKITVSDFDGKFSFENITSGEHTITVKYPTYVTKKINAVKTQEGEITDVTIAIISAEKQLNVARVKTKPKAETNNALLLAQKNSTTVSGTGVDGQWIQLYVDGSIPYTDLAGTIPVGRVQVSGGVWSVTVNSNVIYLGATIKVTASTASTGGCESGLSASSVTVQCVPPALQTYTGGSKSYCDGQAGSITLNSSEAGVIYALVNAGGVQVGPSTVGTGGVITLYTYPLSANLTGVLVKAYKILSTSCAVTSTTPINFNAVLPSPAITLTNTNVAVLQGTTSALFAYTDKVNSPTNYSLDFSIAAKNQNFVNLGTTVLPSSPITVAVPAAGAVGNYNAFLNAPFLL